MLLFFGMPPLGPISRTYHAHLEASGEITVRRADSLVGLSGIFMFRDIYEMRIVLSKCYQPEELQLLFHDLEKSGAVIFHAESLKPPEK